MAVLPAEPLWLDVVRLSEADRPDALPCRCSRFFSSDVSLPGRTLPESPQLAAVLRQREELRDVRCLRFWEIDRWRFLMEELAAMVTTQG